MCVCDRQFPTRDYSKENVLSLRIRFIINLYFDEESAKRNMEISGNFIKSENN